MGSFTWSSFNDGKAMYMMHVQSCCYANLTLSFFAVLVAVAVAVAVVVG